MTVKKHPLVIKVLNMPGNKSPGSIPEEQIENLASTAIAGYMGLIESVGGNVKKLLHQSFKSAIQNLEYARTASGANHLHYVRVAQEKFIDAISVEENENLISALVGLAMCQHLLGDNINTARTLWRIEEVKLSKSEIAKQIGKTCLKVFGIGHLYLAHSFATGKNPLTGDYNDRFTQFEEYKHLALAMIGEDKEIKINNKELLSTRVMRP